MGSVPYAYIVGRITKHVDIRNYGSKNPGAGNVFHLISWRAGIVALVGDVSKGIIALLIITTLYHFPPSLLTCFGLLAVLGHVFSPFLRFKGGKGAATTGGIFLFILFVAFNAKEAFAILLILFIIWVLLIIVTHSQVVSLAITLPIFTAIIFWVSKDIIFSLSALAFALVVEFFGIDSLKREWKSSYDKYLSKLRKHS